MAADFASENSKSAYKLSFGRRVKEKMIALEHFLSSKRRTVWFSLLASLLLILFYLLIMRPVFDTNDDLNVALFVNRGRPVQDAHWLFPNWILGCLCSALYRVTNMVPWYGLMQYIGLFLAFAGLFWGIQQLFRSGAAFLLALALLNFFAADACIRMQFTKTAGICAAGGLFLVVCSVWREKICYPALAAGMAVSAYGFMYRHLEADIMFALWAVFGIYLLLRLKKDAAEDMLKRAFRYILVFALTFLLCLTFRMVDRMAYSSNPEAKEYEQINDARSQLTDYGFPKYEEHKELFEELGISYTAYKLFSRWNFYDPDVFTLEKIKALNDAQTKRQWNLELIKSFLDTYPFKWFQNPMFYCFLVTLIMALLFGRRGWERYVAVVLLILGLAVLFLYLFKEGRFNLERTENPIWLCASLILVSMISPERFNIPPRYTLMMILILLAMNQNNWRDEWRHNTREKEAKMKASQNFVAEVSSDKDHLYLTKVGLYALSPAYGPLSLVPLDAGSNMAPLGGWPSGSPVYQAATKAYGVTNPYRDCINNDKVRLIDNDISTTINYIHEYYDSTARAEEAGMFDEDNMMYRIVSDGGTGAGIGAEANQ